MGKRISWSAIPGLQHTAKADYCATENERRFFNSMIERIEKKYPDASEVELVNWFRVVMLMSKLRMANNNNVLIDGQTREGTLSEDEFDNRKLNELKLIPQLDKQLADALNKTGETKQQKKISEDVATSAQAAELVRKYQELLDGHTE